MKHIKKQNEVNDKSNQSNSQKYQTKNSNNINNKSNNAKYYHSRTDKIRHSSQSQNNDLNTRKKVEI